MAKRTSMTQKTPVTSKSSPEQPTSSVGVSGSQPMRTPERQAGTAPSSSQRSAQTQTSSITHDMIAHRAYEIWRSRGGSDMENWLRAERELQGGAQSASM